MLFSHHSSPSVPHLARDSRQHFTNTASKRIPCLPGLVHMCISQIHSTNVPLTSPLASVVCRRFLRSSILVVFYIQGSGQGPDQRREMVFAGPGSESVNALGLFWPVWLEGSSSLPKLGIGVAYVYVEPRSMVSWPKRVPGSGPPSCTFWRRSRQLKT